MSLILALALAAQITSVQPMPKGTGLPPPATEEEAVMVPVNGLFAAIAARDGVQVLAHVLPDGGVIATDVKPDGTHAYRRTAWAQWAAAMKPGVERFQERLYDPAIEIDGDVAMVWGRYDFLVDGKLIHCGYDHFDLVRDTGQWKIANITYSKRTTGCSG